MTITEASRHRLHEALIEKLGEEEASTLMEHLPPVGWAGVATKTDIEHLRLATSSEVGTVRSDIDSLSNWTKAEFSAVRSDIDSLSNWTKAEHQALAAKMDGRFEAIDQRFDALESRLTATLATTLTSHVRWVVATIFASYAILGVLLGIWR
ncbi:MAG: hypothetical protein H6515_13205 [Microthrixaceae bacterium]|nr:hypothetical protein [Microthrixaceae bacterium]